MLLLLAAEDKRPDQQIREFYCAAAEQYRQAVKQAVVKEIPNSLHMLILTNPLETTEQVKAFLAK